MSRGNPLQAVSLFYQYFAITRKWSSSESHLRSLKRPDLDEVFVAPRIGELVIFPAVVDGEQRQMIAFGLMELGLFLIGYRLFI